jgi:hypothetical protein
MDLLKGEIERKRKELEETNVLGVSYLRSFLFVVLIYLPESPALCTQYNL